MQIFIYDTQSDKITNAQGQVLCDSTRTSFTGISSETSLVSFLEIRLGYIKHQDALIINGHLN